MGGGGSPSAGRHCERFQSRVSVEMGAVEGRAVWAPPELGEAWLWGQQGGGSRCAAEEREARALGREPVR